MCCTVHKNKINKPYEEFVFIHHAMDVFLRKEERAGIPKKLCRDRSFDVILLFTISVLRSFCIER